MMNEDSGVARMQRLVGGGGKVKGTAGRKFPTPQRGPEMVPRWRLGAKPQKHGALMAVAPRSQKARNKFCS